MKMSAARAESQVKQEIENEISMANILSTGYVRDHCIKSKIKIPSPSSIQTMISSYSAPFKKWISKVIGNVVGGGKYVYNFSGAITSIKFAEAKSNDAHLLIHGCTIRLPEQIIKNKEADEDDSGVMLGDSDSEDEDDIEQKGNTEIDVGNTTKEMELKVGDAPDAENYNETDFDGYVNECWVYYGGWMNTIKGLKFKTNKNETYTAGKCTISSNMNKCYHITAPNKSYEMTGFYGGSGWFIDSIGFIFTEKGN